MANKTFEEVLARLVADLGNVAGDHREECIETLVAFSRFAKDCGFSPARKRLMELAEVRRSEVRSR
jgi:hypothetical protein